MRLSRGGCSAVVLVVVEVSPSFAVDSGLIPSLYTLSYSVSIPVIIPAAKSLLVVVLLLLAAILLLLVLLVRIAAG